MDNGPSRTAGPPPQLTLPTGDYVAPGLATVIPDHAFPNMIIGDTSVPPWPWLRRWVQHNWYTDARNPDTGFASRDEAAILYNTALQFADKPCLELGCWRGWSTVHLALGAGTLDVIDPILVDPAFADSVRASCEAAGVLHRVSLHADRSPGAIHMLARQRERRWSLIFIDADHEGDSPRLDAEAVMQFAADSAIVLFHDLAAPSVAAGLDAMRNAGWRTMVYQTMQIMGVAWRGDVEPIAHRPDADVVWTLPKHLAGYEVSGWQRPRPPRRDGAWWPCMNEEDRLLAAAMRAQAAEDRFADAFVAHAKVVTMAAETERRLSQLQQEMTRVQADAADALERQAASIRTEAADECERYVAAVRTQLEAGHAQTSAHLQRSADQLRSERDAALIQLAALSERTGAIELERNQLLRRSHAAERSIAELVAANGRCESAIREKDADRPEDAAPVLDQEPDAPLLDQEAGEQDVSSQQDSIADRDFQALEKLAAWAVHKRVLLGLLRRSRINREAAIYAQAAVLGIHDTNIDDVRTFLSQSQILFGLLGRSGESALTLLRMRFVFGPGMPPDRSTGQPLPPSTLSAP